MSIIYSFTKDNKEFTTDFQIKYKAFIFESNLNQIGTIY